MPEKKKSFLFTETQSQNDIFTEHFLGTKSVYCVTQCRYSETKLHPLKVLTERHFAFMEIRNPTEVWQP